MAWLLGWNGVLPTPEYKACYNSHLTEHLLQEDFYLADCWEAANSDIAASCLADGGGVCMLQSTFEKLEGPMDVWLSPTWRERLMFAARLPLEASATSWYKLHFRLLNLQQVHIFFFPPAEPKLLLSFHVPGQKTFIRVLWSFLVFPECFIPHAR